MKIGDIIINPYTPKEFKSRPNPMYKSMVVNIGPEYTTCLRIDGKNSRYYTRDIKSWEVVKNIDLKELIMGSEVE